ncbi:HTH-type transcriptional activator CmpR [Achromobacter veterisilvae]|jgi:DNA-binding transcriptional LysR family regulator|uniref:HTH-type transcriptional activator CmpR n=2 Tax=Achromobacter veterisilvae TaxID=2069367 RepID=A0A446CPM7_9BURK|nr:HTH-type transcriptional activator CmpR [Achromobacter veterisilvae]
MYLEKFFFRHRLCTFAIPCDAMSRPLNFRQIEAFHAVMLAGTTTGAAQMLRTTQPSISRLLGQVQQASGLKLFDMERGRLRPTREAKDLFDTVKRHFVGLERIEDRLAAMRRSGSGVLRLACTPALGLGVLPGAVEAFAQRYPDVHINMQTMGSQYLREGLLHGTYDVVVTAAPLDGALLDLHDLHESEAVCVLRPDHPLAALPSIDILDLNERRLLVLNADDDVYLQLRGAMQAHRVLPASEIETTYSSTICALAAAGDGMGIVNPYIAAVFADRLAIRPFTPRLPIRVRMAYPAQTAPSTVTEAFVEILAQRFQALPGPG